MSAKPLSEELHIKENYTVLLLNEPSEYRSKLGKLPANVIVETAPSGAVDLIQVFVASRQELKDQLPKLKEILKPKGVLWITYPKGSSKKGMDINRDSIRELAKSMGLEAVANFSVDAKWAALRLKKT
jgi:hypothetical protein